MARASEVLRAMAFFGVFAVVVLLIPLWTVLVLKDKYGCRAKIEARNKYLKGSKMG